MDILDKIRENGLQDQSDLARLRNILRKMQNLTLDWIRIYHGERESAADAARQAEDTYANLAAEMQKLRDKYE